MRVFTFLFLCFSISFMTAQEDTPTAPRIAVKLDLNESIVTRDFNIEFLEVLEDSRCPKDVVCVWAGQARVKVRISGAGIDEQVLELTLGKKDLNVIFTGEDFILKAAALTPYPTTENMGKREYALLVVDEKL